MSPDEISGGREPARRPPAGPGGRRHVTRGVVALVIVVAAVGSGILLSRSSGRHPSATPTTAAPSPLAIPSSLLPTAPATTPGPPVGIVPVGSDGVALLADPGPEVLDVTGGHAATLGSGADTGIGLGISVDGRYVAAETLAQQSTVEILDMSNHVVWNGAASAAAWSPVSDTLAVVDATGVDLLHIAGGAVTATHLRIVASYVDAPVWSPDGHLIAVGADRRLLVADDTAHLLSTAMMPAGINPQPVTWSADGRHLVVFAEGDSTSVDADGVEIQVATVAGDDRLTLGSALGTGLPNQAWWHPVGGDEVLGTLGPDRDAASDKRVVRCDLAAVRCTTLAGDSRTSAFDAVPTTSGIAYLSTPNTGGDDGEAPSAGLVLADADGADGHAAEDAPPATQVVADGDLLLLEAVSGDRASIDRYDDGAVRVLTQIADGAGLYEVEAPEIVAWWRPDHAVVR